MVDDEKAIKVLHVPGNIGGNPQSVARMERRFGVDSHAVALYPSSFSYPSDEILFPPNTGLLAREMKRIKLMVKAARGFDIIHYNFGTTIADPPYPRDPERHNRYPFLAHWAYWFYASRLQQFELFVLKRLGKVIFVTYQGNDARQGGYCRQHFDISPAKAGGLQFYSPVWDAEKQRRIRMFDRVANRIYALNPDLLHVLPKRTQFLPYANIDLDDWRPVTTNNSIPRLAHAPSNQGMKGSKYILEAVKRLQSEGIEFQFDLVENKTHAEARKIYENADLLVDQLLIGWYGGLAVEMMALGKPVVCYIRQSDLSYIPAKMRDQLPIITAEPGNIYEVLKQWLTKEQKELKNLGETSRNYVEKWHAPDDITKKMVDDYKQAIAQQKKRR